jgi:HK97 family phage prohead protease
MTETPFALAPGRDLLFTAFDLKSVNSDGHFEGYASLFDHEDMGRDIVVRGAFRDCLRTRGAGGIKMLFQHDPNQPIGIWQQLVEDARGLYAKGRIMTEVAKGAEVLALMRAGVLDGLSIGFRAITGRRDAHTGVRKLQKVDLWEISVVTFPMQQGARIATTKGRPFANKTPTRREFERWLTRDAGFTRSEALALARSGFKGLAGMRDAAAGPDEASRLRASMVRMAKLLR